MAEMTRMSCGAVCRVKRPSTSVTVPMDVPWMRTEAPITDSPLETTWPETRRRRRAQAEEEHGDGEEHLPEGDEPPGAAAPFTDLVRNHNEIGLVVYWLFLSISERA